ncbi:hypothetical protein GCM10025876_26120 [Demequina litorisediminis]|uniref:Uncharacterized protein n=1 Tax=Demequina litorisediminis TaxID=1849022 RepID=A0ABQ6II64_9MICO|nr:hypothetical protein GCM10025876_26120 [Demequina litorisediminis]
MGGWRAAPAWMRALPPPPLSPDVEPMPPTVRRRWLPSVAAGLGFGAMGAVMYTSLYILVGQEVMAAAVVVGVLVGAGLRLGGRAEGWATGVVAAGIAVLSLLAGAVVGQACLDAITLPAPLATTVSAAIEAPVTAVAAYLSEPWGATVAVVLAVCGALVATLTFRAARE